MISHDDLRAFLAVAKHESFVCAAEELRITPPALSRRIKKLEEFVGDPLFDRTTQMVKITSLGQVLLEHATRVVRDFESFRDFAGNFANNQTIKITFACMWSTAGSVVPGLIRDYTHMHENAEFDVQDADADTVTRLVSERQVDFGISMRPAHSDGLSFKPLCEDPVVLACPPGHELCGRRSISWKWLTDSKLQKIDWGVIRLIYAGAFREKLDAARVPYARGVTINHLSTQLGFLEAHFRAIVMPLLAVSLSRAPDIKCIPLTRPILRREIGIVTLPSAKTSRAVTSFLDHVDAEFINHYRKAVDRFEPTFGNRK